MSRTHDIGRIAAVFAALTLAATAAFAQTPSALHTGRLGPGDAQLESGEYYEEYALDADLGDEIIAVAMALEFDPYLILIAPSGDQMDNDDFEGSKDVSLVEIPVDEAGTWTIRVTTYEAGETGEFALMAATRVADGEDAGRADVDEPESFVVKGSISFGRPISGTLGEDDPKRRDGSYYEAYGLDARAGTRVVITLESEDFDPFLVLVSPSGDMESNDDAAEGDLDSRIETTLDESGRWIVIANTLSEDETGDYRLVVRRN